MHPGRPVPADPVIPDDDIAATGATGRAARRRLVALVALLAAVMGGLCCTSAFMLWEMRGERWKEAVTASRNVVEAESADIEQIMRIYDGRLRAAAAAFADPAVAAASPGLRRRALFGQWSDGDALGPVRILDADGRVMADSGDPAPLPADAAELAALARHRADPDPGAAVGPPSMRDGGATVTLSRRIARADGGFAGMACGTIRLDALTGRFRRLRIGERDVVSLFSADGVMLAHAPGDPLVGRRITGSEVMRRFSERRDGTVVAPAAVDGIRRVFTFRHIPGWPLLVDVGVSTRELYAPWRRKALGIGLALAAMAVGGGALILALRREINRRLAAEEAVRRSERRFRALADGASDVILRLDAGLLRTYASPSVRTLGYAPEELLGRSPVDWVHPEDRDAFAAAAAAAAARSGGTGDAVCYRVRLRDGSFRWVEARLDPLEDGGVLAILRDVDERKRMEFALEAARNELRRLSAADPLTGLGNRRALDTVLADALRRAARTDGSVSLLIADVDRFKAFNDRYGHPAGDAALRAVARALQRGVRRDGDLAARFGGEEFALVLPDTDPEEALAAADALRAAVRMAGVRHQDAEGGMLSVSVGVATVRPGADRCGSADALLRRADAALYAAKRAGRDAVRMAAAAGRIPGPVSVSDRVPEPEPIPAPAAMGA